MNKEYVTQVEQQNEELRQKLTKLETEQAESIEHTDMELFEVKDDGSSIVCASVSKYFYDSVKEKIKSGEKIDFIPKLMIFKDEEWRLTLEFRGSMIHEP